MRSNEMTIPISGAQGKDVSSNGCAREDEMRAGERCTGMMQMRARAAHRWQLHSQKSFHRSRTRRWRE
ncbi:hypothetical protein JQ607_18625 [Bradyrhizobium liaoningense]|uniref:hypothetical protein n=1 Tax=Bradyrhizobium liaoningense TaxID=43992 RepID=UPI001BABFA33|nr:hypothetical protein [Bradyrhizobium liaoningense]MBR0842218.1 hypothetical protein [Bradyrhizobium liaoningense]